MVGTFVRIGILYVLVHLITGILHILSEIFPKERIGMDPDQLRMIRIQIWMAKKLSILTDFSYIRDQGVGIKLHKTHRRTADVLSNFIYTV
jgi:hypothetical protein